MMKSFLFTALTVLVISCSPSAVKADEPLLGEVRMFAGNFAPRGWAFCDGQLLAISDNSALFSLLGTIYGGDGRTTFALPDLRGRAPIHAGQGPGLNDVPQGRRSDGAAVSTAPTGTSEVSTQPTLAIRYIIALQGTFPSRN